MKASLILVFGVLIAGAVAFRQQSVGIRGRLLCGTKPLADTQVKLWNKNKLGSDDQLAAAKTDAQGNYELTGGVGSLFGMNVHFKVYHDCDDGVKPCQRKVDLKVPDQYVTRSSDVQKFFDAGTMNMEFGFPDEERSCIN
uniref:Transthyretin-like family protein n=1 Tax=Panagrolaimus superbus TaxID=310955 RepID=A0A914YYZ8_9BILA